MLGIAVRRTFFRIFVILLFAALTNPLLARRDSNPWAQTDWHQWSRKDADAVLYHSPWIANCCREWNDEKHGTEPPDVGISAALVSSLAVRQALVRRMQLDVHYDAMSPIQRQGIDDKTSGCLNRKFADQIVLTSASEFADIENLMSNAPVEIQKKTPAEVVKKSQSNWIYLVTSDGRKISKLSVNPSDSAAQACGLTKNLDKFPDGLYGPNHEMAFPRFLDGKPTIQPSDKVIRFKVDRYNAEIEFRTDKLVYNGKPDF